MSSRVQYSLLMRSLNSFQGVALAAANPSICICASHQVSAIPSKVPVAHMTLRASGRSHMKFLNVPLKVLGRQSMKFWNVQRG
ncbi:hypothetical protein Hanom_Chr09g00789751 [Helianthus anomalus]